MLTIYGWHYVTLKWDHLSSSTTQWECVSNTWCVVVWWAMTENSNPLRTRTKEVTYYYNCCTIGKPRAYHVQCCNKAHYGDPSASYTNSAVLPATAVGSSGHVNSLLPCEASADWVRVLCSLLLDICTRQERDLSLVSPGSRECAKGHNRGGPGASLRIDLMLV